MEKPIVSWTENERLFAVKLINNHYDDLFAKFKGATTGAKKKDGCWERILEEMNSSGIAQCRRSVEQLKTMYKNVKCRAKTKEMDIRKTGGGPRPKLTASEEEVLSQLREKPQLTGIDGPVETSGATEETPCSSLNNEMSESVITDRSPVRVEAAEADPAVSDIIPAIKRQHSQTNVLRNKRRKETAVDELYSLEVKRAKVEIALMEQKLENEKKNDMFVLEKEILLEKKKHDNELYELRKELLQTNLKQATETALFTFET